MAQVVADRIRDTTTTTGTGAVVVSGTAPATYLTFSARCSVNDTLAYFIAHQTLDEWEVGIGTYSAANTLTRTTVLSSSNADVAVSFSAGTKDVVLSAIAKDTTFRLYNTSDAALANFERAAFDWTTTANVLTIGTQKLGTGSARSVSLVSTTGQIFFPDGTPSAPSIANASNTNTGFYFDGARELWTNAGRDPSLIVGAFDSTAGFFMRPDCYSIGVGFNDLTLFRVAAGVAGLAGVLSSVPTVASYLQWGGQARVTSDFSKTSDTSLANVTGLTVNVTAGRTYAFEAKTPFTCAAAGGVQAAIAGTATATNIIYNGYIVDSGANGIKGNTQATALGTAVASATTVGTTGIITIVGTITVNAAGTLTVQFAQNTSNATASVAKRGSYFLVYDMP